MVRSSVKSAEVSLNSVITDSNIGTKEVRARLCESIMKGMVNDMSGVYKIPMVRMAVMPDETPECKGLKMPHTEMYVWVDTQTVRFSRNGCYELP